MTDSLDKAFFATVRIWLVTALDGFVRPLPEELSLAS